MFEPNMDEYLDEEIEYVKVCYEQTCRAWESQVSIYASCHISFLIAHEQLLQQSGPTAPGEQKKGAEVTQVRFIGSSNPAQVKRNVLASFTDVLLLPVTIVPRTAATVGKAVAAGGSAAVQGIAMLNPQKWGASSNGDTHGAAPTENGFGKRFSKLGSWRQSRSGSVDHSQNWYTQDFEKGTNENTLFEIGDADEDVGAEGNDSFLNGEDMDMENEKTDRCKHMGTVSDFLSLMCCARVRLFEYDSQFCSCTLSSIKGHVFHLCVHANVHSDGQCRCNVVRQIGPSPFIGRSA